MPVQYLESFIEYFRVRDRTSFAYLFISLVLCVLTLGALHLRDTVCVILQTLQSASRSEEIAWIQTYNQVESYLAQQSCVMCSSSITSRCPKCEAVAYCSKEKCLRDHWEMHHGKECHLLADFKGRKMNHLAQYSKEECKPCEDVGKSTNQASEFGRSTPVPENISPSRQKRRAISTLVPENISSSKQERRAISTLVPENISSSKQERRAISTLVPENISLSKQERRAISTLVPENISPSKQERRAIARSKQITQITSTTCNEESIATRSFVNCHSTSEGRYSKGKVAIYREGPLPVDGVGGIMVKASTPKRVTPSRNRASEHADHGVIPCRYSTFIRSSSSHSTGSSSEDSSDSDAMSSLHDLDY